MALLGIDIGTTHSKVGLFHTDGTAIAIASRPTLSHQHKEGHFYYDPEEMWKSICSAIYEVTEKSSAVKINAIGITSMAESGLLVDKQTGEPRSLFMPWFDMCSKPQSDLISAQSSALERFKKSGLHNSFKLGLAKLLWIRDRNPEALHQAVWLSSSSYIAYRLTGKMAFDYSLAARTYAFQIDEKKWDENWIKNFGLNPEIFPEAIPAGTILGNVTDDFSALGLSTGIPVTIAGHDHVSAALAVGAISPEVVYNSMGTAETMVGTLNEKSLGQEEFDSGLSYGCHIAKDRFFWMGGNSSSGGSVEWIRKQLGDLALSYEQILHLLTTVKPEPTGILYYPYLSGSGAPHPNPQAKASFIGLLKEHGKAELIKAVLEGTAYQLESIRRGAEGITNSPIETLVVVGGGTRNPHWLQIKADVSNCLLELPPIEEASLLGAALAAGVGSGLYASVEEAIASIKKSGKRKVLPIEAHHEVYRHLYEVGYLKLQAPLREFFE